MMLSDVCLSVAYVGSKSRTERPRKTKIDTEVAHITRDNIHHFQGQWSKSPGRFAHRRVGSSGGCSGGRGNVLAARNCCYVAVCSAAQGASASTGEERGGAYRGGRPPTACSRCLHPGNYRVQSVKKPLTQHDMTLLLPHFLSSAIA